jgi:hypothetical protein
MVNIRVVVPDAAGLDALVRRLAVVFDRPSISLIGAHNEVRVHSEWESRAVVQVVDAVEEWLAEDGAASAELWMGDRSYTVVRPVPVTSMW